MALILLQLFLDRRKHLGLHERGDRDGEPVLRRDIHRRDGPARLQRAPTLGPQPRAQRLLPRLAKGGGPLIGWILQHAPHHTAIPHGLPGAGHLAAPG